MDSRREKKKTGQALCLAKKRKGSLSNHKERPEAPTRERRTKGG